MLAVGITKYMMADDDYQKHSDKKYQSLPFTIGNYLAVYHKKTKLKAIYYEENFFLQTPSKPGVLVGKTFSNTPDEARSVGLAKACVF